MYISLQRKETFSRRPADLLFPDKCSDRSTIQFTNATSFWRGNKSYRPNQTCMSYRFIKAIHDVIAHFLTTINRWATLLISRKEMTIYYRTHSIHTTLVFVILIVWINKMLCNSIIYSSTRYILLEKVLFLHIDSICSMILGMFYSQTQENRPIWTILNNILATKITCYSLGLLNDFGVKNYIKRLSDTNWTDFKVLNLFWKQLSLKHIPRTALNIFPDIPKRSIKVYHEALVTKFAKFKGDYNVYYLIWWAGPQFKCETR